MIAIAVVDEHGNVVEEINGEAVDLFMAQIPQEGIESFKCLPFIDPWGDTVFNTLQIQPFLEELAWVRHRAGTEAQRESVDAVERLAKAAGSQPHLYLKFIGD